MKLIVGLGNPGEKYIGTRHNAGFLILEEVAKHNKLKFRVNRRLKASIARGKIAEEAIILLKPQTFMNLSGEAVSLALNWFKLTSEDVLVLVDDIALKFGTIRIRKTGSSGGQKGLESIINYLGTNKFNRMRIGIMNFEGRRDLSKYVLSNFKKDETKTLPDILKYASLACECWVKEGVDKAMNKFNGGYDE